jgi:hypothetical protein
MSSEFVFGRWVDVRDICKYVSVFAPAGLPLAIDDRSCACAGTGLPMRIHPLAIRDGFVRAEWTNLTAVACG